MARETCWRCGKVNKEDNLICDGCGIENPGLEPGKTVGSTGDPDRDAAFERFKNRESAIPVSGATSRVPTSSRTATVASRLATESSIAINYIYVTTWITTGILALAVLIYILAAPVDGLAKFLVFIATGIFIGLIWVSTMLVVPFYSYMNMRALEKLDR